MIRNFITFVFFVIPVFGQAQSLQTITKNNSAVAALEKENAPFAERELLGAMASDPFRSDLRYNLGLAFFVQKKFDRALKEFESVARALPLGGDEKSQDLRFKALFNAALASQELKNVDKALELYQAALAVRPDSIEVKTNIELLNQSGGGGGGEQQQQPQDPNQGQGEQPQEPQEKEKGVDDRDVKDILEELERQEQKIRALEYGDQKGREKGPSKDW